MELLKIIATAWVAVFVQSSLVHYLAVFGNIPDLLSVAIAAYALRAGTARSTAFGALVGFLADCYRPDTMGLLTLSGAGAGWLAGTLRERIYQEQPASQMALAAFLALVRQPFEFLGTAGGSLSGYPWLLVRYGLGSALYTAGLSFFLMPVIDRWLKRKKSSRLSDML